MFQSVLSTSLEMQTIVVTAFSIAKDIFNIIPSRNFHRAICFKINDKFFGNEDF